MGGLHSRLERDCCWIGGVDLGKEQSQEYVLKVWAKRMTTWNYIIDIEKSGENRFEVW